MKKQLKNAILATLTAATFCGAGALAGCGNKDWIDWNYTFRYIVINEGGNHVLHKVESWTDSESESLTLHTECCENYIWTSSNNANLYEDMPGEEAYDTVCSKLDLSTATAELSCDYICEEPKRSK